MAGRREFCSDEEDSERVGPAFAKISARAGDAQGYCKPATYERLVGYADRCPLEDVH